MGDAETQDPGKPEAEELQIAERTTPLVPAIVIAVVVAGIGIAIGFAINWFPVQASTQAHQVDTFYNVLIVVSVPVFVLVTGVVLYSVWRFRMRPGEENMDGPPIHGNTRLEVIWTTIPAVVMLGLCVYAAIELHNAEAAPANGRELDVRVVGQQFEWTFYYQDPSNPGKEIASPQLYLPKDESVKFKVQTKDVLHDFWVPAFRWKIDAVPGISTGYRVTPDRLGNYPVVCAELCGLGHAVMRAEATVLTQQQFDSWLSTAAKNGGATAASSGGSSGSATPAASGGSDQADTQGAQLFTANGCSGCHTLKAAGSNATIGPDLDQGLKGKSAAFIKESIVDPNKVITKGYGANIMPPNFGQSLTPAEQDALVKYLQDSTKG